MLELQILKQTEIPQKRCNSIVSQIPCMKLPQIGIKIQSQVEAQQLKTSQSEILQLKLSETKELQVETQQIQSKILQSEIKELHERMKNMEDKMKSMEEMMIWMIKRKQEKDENFKIMTKDTQQERVEEIPTKGMKRITKDQVEKMDNETLEIMIGRISKNISIYKKKHGEEKREEIEAMSENLRIMREVKNERKIIQKK